MEIKRRFIIGEDWLNIKIYSGPRALEEILLNDIYPIIDKAYSSNLISKFFFVRYSDEGYHIRLRFKLTNGKESAELLNQLSEQLNVYSDSRIISKVITDTYNREIERYGSLSIDPIETIFSWNSWQIIKLLIIEQEYKNRWLTGIKIMDDLLNKFGLDTKEKYDIYQQYYLMYAEEFGDNKNVKDELKRIYRGETKDIERIMKEILSPDIDYPATGGAGLDSAINEIMDLRADNRLEVPFESLLRSIIHMHYNRLFRIRQREHEYVVYYMMSNYYKSLLMREKK